ncbi:MAG TPA: alpha/beta hydrolase [Gaiella sp.]|nr:alpha/beta hydrolase [Gaiella sp.]
MTGLHVHAWGEESAPALVCLHGVTAWGGHFESLASALAPTHRVVAPDLLGHGRSPREPPWRLGDHLDAVERAVGDARLWLGHSFGARIAFQHAARHPGSVERLVLLDPAIVLPPHVALWAAENARAERTYASFEEAVDRRYEESQLHAAPRRLVEAELRGHLVEEDGVWRYRYTQASVVSAYSELATTPPAFEAVRLPTLLVLGAESYLPYDHLLDDHRSALGDLLEVVVVPGGHTVLWDALDETAEAVTRFLAAAPA